MLPACAAPDLGNKPSLLVDNLGSFTTSHLQEIHQHVVEHIQILIVADVPRTGQNIMPGIWHKACR